MSGFSNSREAELFLARTCLREARLRRQAGQNHMASVLLKWAGNARRRAMARSRDDDLPLFAPPSPHTPDIMEASHG